MDHERFNELVTELDSKLAIVTRMIDRYDSNESHENAQAIATTLWKAGKVVKTISLEFGELWDIAHKEDGIK